MTAGTMRLTHACPGDGHCNDDCATLAAAERAAAKRTKPGGYTWPLYNQPRKPDRLPVAHLNRSTHPITWVNDALACRPRFISHGEATVIGETRWTDAYRQWRGLP